MVVASISKSPVRRQPRPYQLQGSGWLLDKGRAFLTDGFGLGKTSQAIWAAEVPAMVACPRVVIPHWVREIKACWPEARIAAATAPDLATRMIQLNVEADFYVFNIELLRTDMDKWFVGLRKQRGGVVPIHTFIVDEAHRLRGRNSTQARGADRVAQLVGRVYFLTATAVYNQVDNLYWPLHMLDPKRFPGYYRFLNDYCKVIQTSWGPKVIGLKNDRALKGVFAEYALGRTRAEVSAQLPLLQETVIEIDPDPEFRKLYKDTRQQYRDRFQKLLLTQQNVLTALRSLTQQAKAPTIAQLVMDAGAEHTLIYTYHKDLAYVLGHLLKWPVITGDMPAIKREAVAKANDCIVATFPSVAEGIDLSHIQHVIYAEQDWIPGIMDQSLNRVHRPTSPHTHTNVSYVIVKKTVDSVIYKSFKFRELGMDEIVNAALVPFDDDDDDDEAE